MWVQSSMKLLPPATGPTTGTVGDAADGVPVRIAVLGESTAAGCGVEAHNDGFPGSLARTIAERTGRPVTWETVGHDGATGRRIRYRLLPQISETLTVAVLLAGTNDVLSRRSPAQWAEDLDAIVSGLADRAEHVLVVGIPSFETFPSLPTTLRRYLAKSAGTLDEASQRVCAQRPRVTWVNLPGSMQGGPGFFSPDRFHPSAYGYLRLAQEVADQITL
jgi:lysophospholipase L1-like esterase